MNKLVVIGNCYADNQDKAKELFEILTNAGYMLGYQTDTSVVIMKEVQEENE